MWITPGESEASVKKATDAGLEHAISSSAIPETGALPLSQPALLNNLLKELSNSESSVTPYLLFVGFDKAIACIYTWVTLWSVIY
jgi:hypothetical protein